MQQQRAAIPNNNTADFGYYVDPATVGDFVWLDLNGDGLQQAGEPGFFLRPVMLEITFPNGDTITITTFTTADGIYDFTNLLLDEDFNGVGAFATPGVGGGVGADAAHPRWTG